MLEKKEAFSRYSVAELEMRIGGWIWRRGESGNRLQLAYLFQKYKKNNQKLSEQWKQLLLSCRRNQHFS